MRGTHMTRSQAPYEYDEKALIWSFDGVRQLPQVRALIIWVSLIETNLQNDVNWWAPPLMAIFHFFTVNPTLLVMKCISISDSRALPSHSHTHSNSHNSVTVPPAAWRPHSHIMTSGYSTHLLRRILPRHIRQQCQQAGQLGWLCRQLCGQLDFSYGQLG